MRIELDLPEWVDSKNIHIFAGIEEVARKHKDAPWEIKVSRCSMCGRCCMTIYGRHPFADTNGRCRYLEKEIGDNDRYLCGLKGFRPHNCGIAAPSHIPECTVRYEVI